MEHFNLGKDFHPADWMAGEDRATLQDVTYKRAVCDCDDCVRLEKAAEQIDDIPWWTDDEAARAVAKA